MQAVYNRFTELKTQDDVFKKQVHINWSYALARAIG